MLKKNKYPFLQFNDNYLSKETIEELELLNNLRLPPIFKAFIQVFQPYLAINSYMDENISTLNNFVVPIFLKDNEGDFTLEDDELSFECFMKIEEVFDPNIFQMYLDDFGLIPISHHAFSGSLMLGCRPKNLDQIFLMRDSNEFEFIAENILHFIYQLEIDFFDIPTKLIPLLYKNWGEDFWRIREEDNT